MNDLLKKSSSDPLFNVPFLLVLASDHVTGACGLTPTVRIRKRGGAFIAPTGAVTEIKIAAPTFPGSGVFTGAASTGGHLAANTTYYWKFTYSNGIGETEASAEVSYTTPNNGSSTNKIDINLNAAPAGAATLNAYRATSTGGELFLESQTSSLILYSDISANTPTVPAPPSANTTSGGWYELAANSADNDVEGKWLFHAIGTSTDPVDKEYRVVPWDPSDVVRLGLTAFPNVAQGNAGQLPTADASGRVTVISNADKTGYSLTQSFPSNFANLAIDGSGRITVGTNADKTGYSLTQSFPANFASLAIAGTGQVGLDFSNIKQATSSTTLNNITIPTVTNLTNGVALVAGGLDAVIVEVAVGGGIQINARQALCAIVSESVGVFSGASATSTSVAIAAAGNPTVNRIQATVDQYGNRSSVILNLPA